MMPIFRIVLVFAAALLPLAAYSQTPKLEPGVSHDLAKWRAAHYSDVRYKLNLTIEKMSPVLKGSIETRVVVRDTETHGRTDAASKSEPGATATGYVTPIILDWRKIKGHEKDSTITSVSINGRDATVENHPVGETPPPLLRKEGSLNGPLTFTEHNEHLIFREGVVPGENVIKLDFTSPILTSGSAVTRYIDKEDGSEYIYSLFVPSDASTAFPVFDQPDLKAVFTLSVDSPAGWTTASNSMETLQVEGKSGHILGIFPKGIYHSFGPTAPISTYVFAFAAGPFAEISELNMVQASDKLIREGKKVELPGKDEFYLDGEVRKMTGTHVFVRKSQAEKFKPHAAEVFRLNREAVKFFEEYFDYKFPFPKYDIVLIPEFPFGGMEHAGATFLRESSVIFPQEPTKNDEISRATLIFHETAHQWFGDTVTMRWFDDLWLKEGFANFMAYKALEKIMPEANAWKVFYERIKQPAYATDSTKGTTPIYQKIDNLSAAKSAYGNIVYNKAPAFLRQAEFYIGEDKFQTAVRAFLKKHEYANATWEDLVKEFEAASGSRLKSWADVWITQKGVPLYKTKTNESSDLFSVEIEQSQTRGQKYWWQRVKVFGKVKLKGSDLTESQNTVLRSPPVGSEFALIPTFQFWTPDLVSPNYGDYGYGIFLLDEKSREYVLKNIQNEKDPFLRSMMWGALWDSVREGELDPKEFEELAYTVLYREEDVSIISMVMDRVITAYRYYLDDAERVSVIHPLEDMIEKEMLSGRGLDKRITYYRTYIRIASTMRAHGILKKLLNGKFWPDAQKVGGILVGTRYEVPLKTKDKFDIVTRLIILGDPEALKLLEQLEKTETSDDAKRYAYAARAGIATPDNKAKYWNDFISNKDISESWIEAALGPWNSIRQSDLTLPYLERALKELPNHKRSRKIFFVNGWLGAFIGGQRSEEALGIINKFLADNPKIDNDLRLKILENADTIERAAKIRKKF